KPIFHVASADELEMTMEMCATTVGTVLGPSFTSPWSHLGETLGMNGLAGPYLISMAAFALATLFASTLTKTITAGTARPGEGADEADDGSGTDRKSVV